MNLCAGYQFARVGFVTSFDRKRYRTLIATKNTQLDNLPGRCNSDFLLLYFCLKSNSFCRAPNFNQNRMPLRYFPLSVCVPALVPLSALGVCFVQKRRLKANLEDEFELNYLSQLSICQALGSQIPNWVEK